MMKVLIAAGGTGGHIYPGIAVAKEIVRRDAVSEVLFVGTTRGLETKIVPDNGFQLSLINSAGLKNVGLIGKLKGLAVLPRSFLEARTLLKEFKPDVVVGAGGYVSGPVLMIASLMRIPTLVMDSNALPGFTNRRLAMFVDKAALTFEEALPYFGKKGVVTGNPVRKEFFEIPPRENDGMIRILVFGGSQGSRAINQAMMRALPLLEVHRDKLWITHQTGPSDLEEVRAFYQLDEWTRSFEVVPYISDMASVFAKSDLVVCRAGATTCAELAAAGRASIMIPLPTAADDHQRKNAEAMQAAGAAMVVLQEDSFQTSSNLGGAIKLFTWEPEKIAAASAAAKRMGKPRATEDTVDLIEKLAGITESGKRKTENTEN